jgi:CBS domain containing-hemolysin-like protein
MTRSAHGRTLIAPWLAVAAALAATPARASFLPPDLVDAAADWLAIIVIIVVPIAVIVVFWLVHILPEKVAEKRHHPQLSAITCLCLLSLVFGGLLWPIAWLWAYTRPVGYRMAYGTEKHDSYFAEQDELLKEGKLSPVAIAHLRGELDEIAKRGALTPAMRQLRADLEALPPSSPTTAAAPAA